MFVFYNIPQTQLVLLLLYMLRCLLLLTFLFFLESDYCHGQTKTIYRLKQQIISAPDETKKLSAILALCDQGYSLHADTLMAYAKQAGVIATKRGQLHDELNALFYQCFALTNKGLIDSSLKVAERCIALSAQVKDPVLLGNVLNQKGRCYMRKNQYKEAMDMGHHVITEAEKGKDVILQMRGKTLIAWAYLEIGQSQEALNWHLSALRTTSDTSLLEKYGILFANLALNYSGLGKRDSAFFYIDKAIRYSRRTENLFALSNSLAIEAQLYVRSGKARLAEAPLKEVVEIRRLIGDPFYIVSDMAQLGLYYAENGEPEKGIAICNEGIAISNQYKIGTKLSFLYSSLSENYKAMGNTAKYAEVLEEIIAIKDSVYQLNSAEALAEMQAKYDLQRKENVIIQQKLNIVSKNSLLYGSLCLILFGAIISLLLFRDYRRKQRIVFQSMQEEEKHKAQQAVLTAEEKERKRIAADLHDNMGAYASAIAANVDDMMMEHPAEDNTILYRMKTNATEIMTNLRDTIWVLNKDAISITGISDRFKNYIVKIIQSYPAISTDVKENIVNDILLSPENALNMLRIMQEAFHNAIKHSGCTNITIEITSDECVQLRIVDDGRGFILQKDNLGNGLKNIQQRAKANGWQLKIESMVARGTSIELCM